MTKNNILLLVVLGLLCSCQIQGELLWVQKVKKVGPPICVSSFLASSNKSATRFPLYKLKLSHNRSLIYYKNKKLYDSSHFLRYQNGSIELYKNSIIIISDRKVGEDQPFQIARREIILVELASPKFYFVAKFKEPINIISSEIIKMDYFMPLDTAAKDSALSSYDSFYTLEDYNFYCIDSINLEKEQITLIKVAENEGSYILDTTQEKLKINLERIKNPIQE